MTPWTLRLHRFRTGGRSGPVGQSIRVGTGRRVPGWWLRVAAPVGALLALPLLQTQAAGTMVVLGTVAALLIRPGGFAPVMLTLVSALWVLTREPFPIEVFPLLFVTHLVLVLAGMAGHVSWSGHVDAAALKTQFRRFWRVQALSQSLAVVAWWLTSTGFAALSLQLLAAIALAALTWVVIRRRTAAF